MQAIKEKLNDMNEMRKAKAEAKDEEKAEKELAKARLEVAHEVRMAREAEAAMDLHVARAAEKMAEHERKHRQPSSRSGRDRLAPPGEDNYVQDSHGRVISVSPIPEHNSSDGMSGSGADLSRSISFPRDRASMDSTASNAGTPDGGGKADGPNQILQ
ncbi:late embryogenesis abundant protein 18-like [Sesamum indicum]|uniref:Late embryogenesis abundant protein 18-like n=1 Tax=Sesamum indicum TaxID=4182 RepID=A0A6I9U3B9_SESIN|nr:late embryogenesis abundant protein 18-like [Sesamum indicum]